MPRFFRYASPLLLALSLASTGCHAQTPAAAAATPAASAPGTPLSPAEARRIEVEVRQRANLPPASTVTVGPRTKSPVQGFDQVAVVITSEDGHSSRPITFLLSPDGKTMAQFTSFPLPENPRTMVSDEGRPARGGPANAPVLIVGFDDLECPFCARLHETIFPALQNRYGNLVHIVYRDYPLTEIHPWAQHAAVDVNCLGAQSTLAYWNAVDYVHAHAGDIGNDPKDAKAQKTLARAEEQLDTLTRDQGKFQKLDEAKLNACLAKQDTSAIADSKKLGDTLGVNSTPILYINGAKIDGAVPLPFIEKIIDQALTAEGRTPPPYPAAPTAATKPAGE